MSVTQDVALDANGRWIKCGLNTKFIVFHTNFGNFLKNFFYLNLFFLKEFFFDKNVSSDNFFSKNFSFLSRPLHCIKVFLH